MKFKTLIPLIILRVVVLILFLTLKTNAQDYIISFAATGATTTIDSVKVENPAKGTTVSILGADKLHLTGTIGINKISVKDKNIQVYPNPVLVQTELSFYAEQAGKTQIVISNISGKEIIQLRDNYSKGIQRFRIAGLKQGLYVVNISSKQYFYTLKLISLNTNQSEVEMEYLGSEKEAVNPKSFKNTKAIIDMSYTSGESLHFTGYSDSYTSIINDVPTASKTITFVFVTVPTLTTKAISNITSVSALSGGNITSDGSANITSHGVCWSTNQNPTIADNKTNDGTGVGNYTSKITGLENNTTYYVRAFATNSEGTGYGNQFSFTTIPIYNCGIVNDIDGNVYHTVLIGTQCWMLENLKTTKYRNGDTIPNITAGNLWDNLATDAYCNWNNDVYFEITYGHLYNWYAVSDSHNIAPIGWHIPTDTEWITLINFLGGDSLAESKLKEIDLPNVTNESGFTALPGGFRNAIGGFEWATYMGYWWSSTSSTWDGTSYAKSIVLDSDKHNSIIAKFEMKKKCGLSIRCIKD